MSNSNWMPNSNSATNLDNMAHKSSTRIDKKRAQPWSTVDQCDRDLFYIKKQAIESIKETSGVEATMKSSLISANYGYGSHALHHPSDSDVSHKNTTSIVPDSVKMVNTGFENFAAMPQGTVSPLYFNSGLRTSEVHDLFPVINYTPIDDIAVTMDPSFGKNEKNLVSLEQASDIPLAHNEYYNVVNNNMLFNDREANVNFSQFGPMYSNKCQENFFGQGQFIDKLHGPFMTMGSSSACNIWGKDATFVPSQPFHYNKENWSVLSMVSNYDKGGVERTINFGGYRENNSFECSLSGNFSSGCGLLLNQSLGSSGVKESTEQLSTNMIASGTESESKDNNAQKTKKGSSGNFPSNVKALLSTGIFDGVMVKYVSWSREKNLRGVINGTGYLCSCNDCNLSKVINAYEFERHAGCKTKHPNNHIYFENGKTVYAVVQELKSTPHDLLFEAIQTITGSKVNQKNFDDWKASFQAATFELQRIYTGSAP